MFLMMLLFLYSLLCCFNRMQMRSQVECVHRYHLCVRSEHCLCCQPVIAFVCEDCEGNVTQRLLCIFCDIVIIVKKTWVGLQFLILYVGFTDYNKSVFVVG